MGGITGKVILLQYLYLYIIPIHENTIVKTTSTTASKSSVPLRGMTRLTSPGTWEVKQANWFPRYRIPYLQNNIFSFKLETRI